MLMMDEYIDHWYIHKTDKETDTYYGEALAVIMAENADKLNMTASDGKHRAQIEVVITKEA